MGVMVEGSTHRDKPEDREHHNLTPRLTTHQRPADHHAGRLACEPEERVGLHRRPRQVDGDGFEREPQNGWIPGAAFGTAQMADRAIGVHPRDRYHDYRLCLHLGFSWRCPDRRLCNRASVDSPVLIHPTRILALWHLRSLNEGHPADSAARSGRSHLGDVDGLANVPKPAPARYRL